MRISIHAYWIEGKHQKGGKWKTINIKQTPSFQGYASELFMFYGQSIFLLEMRIMFVFMLAVCGTKEYVINKLIRCNRNWIVFNDICANPIQFTIPGFQNELKWDDRKRIQ